MATYILFWNPAISSYTMERFLDDFDNEDGVGNWSFHEHEQVGPGDTFYLVRCGEGNVGIVMRGEICSHCYEDEDWSPRNRKHIYYADIDADVCINPESGAPLLTPQILTERLPGFDWFGGHSGRRLSDEMAEKLDELWFEYLDANPQMFANKQAWINDDYKDITPERIAHKYLNNAGHRCELCGYSYDEVFGREAAANNGLELCIDSIPSRQLPKLFYVLCLSCHHAPDEILIKHLSKK